MSNSYRIRTELGKDKAIQVYLDQDFEFLEILSLKLLQSQIYTRPCADYGVVVGRVSVNNGFGIPNAKVSVFIPLTNEDENNPIISELYPYKSLTSVNEDGYRYNLLPYVRQHGGHTPTGTFFDRDDALTNTNIIEVFDKYYKYTARTNESGDFMIFGVPLGPQTLHIDIDLSDIGEFSLSPQDLVRMGVATTSQVAGTNFKASSNLSELPQIVTINRVVEVVPLWGQEDLCTIGITRSDFDLTAESNITISPTAIFMGSLISSNDDQFIKRSCRPKVKQGSLCNLITGFGQILAIRQTIFQDINGRPVLETVELEQGGQVIDENGTWLIDVPMNLDYITTNEFGERVISYDPSIGIPTKAKYRFKVKWNQPPTLKDQIKRGYFLVPNVKEWGWTVSNDDPLTPPLPNLPAYQQALRSYAFSIDWEDYGDSTTAIGRQMIQEAIDCEDRFYPMVFNKVYTVSQMIDQFRKGILPNRTISIKNILDDSCESQNTKFPTNDAVFRFDILYLLFVIIMYIFKPILLILLVLVHILAWLMKFVLGPVLAVVVIVVFPFVILICKAINLFGANLNCPDFDDLRSVVRNVLRLYKRFTNLKIPNLSYPDCELCDCKQGTEPGEDSNDPSGSGTNPQQSMENSGLFTVLSPYFNSQYYQNPIISAIDPKINEVAFTNLLSGNAPNPNYPYQSIVPQTVIIYKDPDDDADNYWGMTTSLPISEKLNLFNNKSKYFNPSVDNPAGGINRVKVTFEYTANTPTSKYHYDNVMVISVSPEQIQFFTPGKLITFQDLAKSGDINLTGVTITTPTGVTGNQFNTFSITGTPINIGPTPVQISYAKFDGSGNDSVTYTITQDADDANYHKFPMDVEYFQVITGASVENLITNFNTSSTNYYDFYKRILAGKSNYMIYKDGITPDIITSSNGFPTVLGFENYIKQGLIFLVRGVDPNSSRRPHRYDLSTIFGKPDDSVVITGQYKMNYPIIGSYKSVSHQNMISDTINTDSYNGTSLPLYYPSFHFLPAWSPSSTLGSFSAFTSVLPSYYSSLDNSLTSSFTPDGLPDSSSIAGATIPALTIGASADLTNTTYGTRVPTTFDPSTGINGFTLGQPYVFTQNSVSDPDYNTGYYPKEIVEGGAYFVQKQLYDTNITPTYAGVGYNFSPRYPDSNFSYTNAGAGQTGKIVMRSDRLPTSSTPNDFGNIALMLHNNPKFAVYFVDDNGVAAAGVPSQNTPNFGDQEESATAAEESAVGAQVLETFSCNSMIPLSCYSGGSGTIAVRDEDDPCYKNGKDEDIMENGCYILITRILTTLINGKDFKLISEWMSRIQITFAACRNVWSHIFTNSWINGTLYAFAFKNDRFFTGPNDTPPNAPYSEYCRYNLFLHPTNNFYYRSSPYSTTRGFLGHQPVKTFGGNRYNIKFPTTILDLGPRSFYQQELSMSDDYDGYVVNSLNSTSYTSVDEILNYLIISRLINQTFIQAMIGTNGSNALSYFNERAKQFVDGDYAQLISISSELGIAEFDTSNYSGNTLFLNDSSSDESVIGVFFSSNTQVRDYITPKRQIISPTALSSNPCAFNPFKVFSQVVPFYQWKIQDDPGNTPQSIFGSQKNTWHTNSDIISGGTSFFAYRYQSLDRIQPASRFFRPSLNTQSQYYKGYIYAVDASGNVDFNYSSWDQNTHQSNVITTGNPFFFYFGLRKGQTAFDRFARQWLNFETITE